MFKFIGYVYLYTADESDPGIWSLAQTMPLQFLGGSIISMYFGFSLAFSPDAR